LAHALVPDAWHKREMHREEREFSIIVHVSAEFADEYTGDEDGFVWHEAFERDLKPRIVSAVFESLRSQAGWRVVAAPRGRDPERAIEIDVIRESAGARD
jgi:hypothetical protein